MCSRNCLGDVRVDWWTGGCAFPATHRLSMKRRRADSGDHAEDAASSSSAGGDFVRGRKPKRAHGGEGEARDARGDVSLMSSSDFLFSKHQAERAEKKRARKELKHARARKDKQEKDADATERTAAGVARLTALPRTVEPMSFKTIQRGDKVLGVVRSVTPVDAVISPAIMSTKVIKNTRPRTDQEASGCVGALGKTAIDW